MNRPISMNRPIPINLSLSTSMAVLFLLAETLLPSCYKKGQPTPVNIAVTNSILDNQFTVPVKVAFINNSSGADSFKWVFPGGDPAESDKRDPGTVVFSKAGDYTVTLEAWNADERKTKEFTLHLDSSVQIGFDTAIAVNYFAPVQVRITNKTIGASSYNWTFQGGTPSSSTQSNPPVVQFDSAGTHTITLQVSNGRQTFTLTKTVTVLPALSASFTVIPSFDNDDYQAPMNAVLHNTTIGRLHTQWSCAGATIGNTAADSSSILFPAPGPYTVTLTTGNDKNSQSITQTITVLPNTNLRTLTDVQLGINTAQSGIGSFYSTRLRKVFTKNDQPDTAGKWIDIVFFGLNASFTYNKFLTPDSAQYYTFAAIPQVSPATFINRQEKCGCGITMSPTDFDNMTNDGPLQGLNIGGTFGDWNNFDNTMAPRIVLFQTHDGRKGAIKIKQFVPNGTASYIVVDIKVQKNL